MDLSGGQVRVESDMAALGSIYCGFRSGLAVMDRIYIQFFEPLGPGSVRLVT